MLVSFPFRGGTLRYRYVLRSSAPHGMGVAFDFKVKSNPLLNLPPQKGEDFKAKALKFISTVNAYIALSKEGG